MHISWLGRNCVKLVAKHLEEDVVVLIDAYKPEKGEFPRSFTPTVALLSQGEDGAATFSQNPLVVTTPGEFETKDCMVVGIPGNDKDLVFKIMAEGLSLLHVGGLSKKLTNEAMEKIGHVDILFVPSGNSHLSAEDAAALATELEPRIVIPVGYQCDTDPKAKPLSEFVKEIGLKPAQTDKKFIIKKKDLPQEDTALFVLEKGS
jgi:hypothetical protein